MHLPDLPVELLINVLCHLDDFDEIDCVKQTCPKFRAILLDKHSYLKVLNSIVARSHVYRYDIGLNRILEFNGRYRELLDVDPVTPENQRVTGDTLRNYLLVDGTDMDDEDVFDVLRRWHDLYQLCYLYCDEAVNKEYNDFVVDLYGEPEQISGLLRARERIGSLLKPRCLKSSKRQDLRRQRRRFHTSLMHYWYAQELHWLFSRCTADTEMELLALNGAVEEFTGGGSSRELLQSFEHLEIYAFVHCFLLRVIFIDAATTKEWIRDTIYYDHEHDVVHFETFLRNCKLFIRPEDVLELLQWTCIPSATPRPRNKSAYLQRRGAFDHPSEPSIMVFGQGFIQNWVER